ncbi:MAG: dihydroorotate dehydrogenase 1B [Promethearchaeota archaeon CR_4]|nr:MAG: dihydroorotate dehydrogenase 1B [Candidatus Lokiarchaeota archaeon CR_4]
MLETNIASLKLKTPFILASGILGVSGSTLAKVFHAGAGAVVSKSIGPVPRQGYNNPSVIEIFPDTFLNAVGLANPGIDEFAGEVKIAKDQGTVIILSVFGGELQEYGEVAKKAEKMGADAIELNISCPHAHISCIGADAQRTSEVVRLVKSQTHLPIIAKLNPNVTDIVEIARSAEKAGVDAITAINTVRGMLIDIDAKCPVLANKSGGISGKLLKPIAVKVVYDLFESVKIPIIGCGGISDWRDAVEFFLAGASAVQIGSALWKGFEIFTELAKGTKQYIVENKAKNLQDIIGRAHKA